MCYVSLNPAKEEKEHLGKYEGYTLPDGNTIKVYIHTSCMFQQTVSLISDIIKFRLEMSDLEPQKYCLNHISLEWSVEESIN